MQTAEQAYEAIVQQIENNRLEAALDQLLAFAGAYSIDKQTAVRMQRSAHKDIESEALVLGDTTSIRERRAKLKLQLFRLAEAIRADARTAASPAAQPAAAAPPFLQARGEGPVNVFLSYAPADEAGSRDLVKGMALLQHLKRIELFDQHQSPTGNRAEALQQALEEAEVALLLISNDYLASAECLQLQQEAFLRHQQNRLAVVPILYSPAQAQWKELEIGKLQALPRNNRFITQWPHPDAAYAEISRELGELAAAVRQRLDYGKDPVADPQPPPRRAYDTEELRELFRQGDTAHLIQQLIQLANNDAPVYDQALLFEQQWKQIYEDEKNRTASIENIDIRKNQLNSGLLKLIREMEGA